MCETLYRPDIPIPQQIEQAMHNASTWRDSLEVMLSTNPGLPFGAVTALKDARYSAELTRTACRLALSHYAYEQGNAVPILNGHNHAVQANTRC